MQQVRLARRAFITRLAAGAGALAALRLGVAPPALAQSGPTAQAAQPINAGPVGNFRVGTATKVGEVAIQRQPFGVWVARVEGGLVAYNDRCRHLGCQTRPFDPNTSMFLCPCHGSRYDIHGSRVVGPTTMSLDLVKLEVRGGNVIVSPADTTERDRFDPAQLVRV
jgi:Rieske Fe-S protein